MLTLSLSTFQLKAYTQKFDIFIEKNKQVATLRIKATMANRLYLHSICSCSVHRVNRTMGNLFSKRSKDFNKQRLEEEHELGDQQNHIITTHNNSVISVSNKEIPLSVPNGRRHDELEDERQREVEIEFKKELDEVRARQAELSQQNKLVSEEVDRFKKDYENGSGKIKQQIEETLVEKLRDERDLIQDEISQQIDMKFKDQDNSVNKLVETSRANVIQEISQQQSEQAYKEVESLKELVRILSISTVVKNTAHLNFSPTEAMDTIEIKISLLNGTEKKTPRMINVHNLMRITTLLELKYHLAEKYKHLKVGELVLKWKGIELSDAATLLEYGICNSDKLDLEVRALVTYMIHIQLGKDSKLQIEVTPATKIRFLKEWLQEKTSIAVEKQLLRHGENILQDEKRLAECQIGEGEVIQVEVCFVGFFTINVACPSGTKHQIEVEPKDTIEMVKHQVSIKQHIHVAQFDLLIRGNFAETSKKLYEFNIVSGETLHLRMCNPPSTAMFPTTFPSY